MKRFLKIAAVVAVCVAAFIAYTHTDYYVRHHGYGDVDQIHIFAVLDGAPLPTSQYAIDGGLDGVETVQKNEGNYSLPGDYGLYRFALTWNGKHADFYLENVNDWWRTNIVLNIRSDETTIEQMNDVYNNNPPFIDVRTIQWEEGRTDNGEGM